VSFKNDFLKIFKKKPLGAGGEFDRENVWKYPYVYNTTIVPMVNTNIGCRLIIIIAKLVQTYDLLEPNSSDKVENAARNKIWVIANLCYLCGAWRIFSHTAK